MGNHLLPGNFHRHRRGPHPAHQAGHGCDQPALSPSLHGREPHGAAGSPHTRAGDAGGGPECLVTDAHILGIDPNVQRDRMDEALGIILRLFREREPITYVSDWFELHDAVLQVRPYQKPHMPIAVASVRSPAGPELAGKHGAAVLSMSVPRETEARADINYLWAVAEASAAEHGQTVRRDEWRL